CAALGAGITSSDTGIISTGTAEVFSRIYPEAPINREMFDGFFPCYEYHLDGYYFTFSLNHTGGLLLKWYCDEFCSDYRLYAAQLKENVFSYLDSKCPLGPTDLFFLPHLNGSGTPWCDTGSKGALIGIKLQTDRAAVYKALMESLTYELAVNVELLELNHKAVNEITAVGGGASSDVWMQLKADILGRPIRRIAIKEAGCLGAAMLAGKGVDVFSDYEYASKICVNNAKIFYPSEKYGNIYREKLKVYKELYPALVPFNREL
ncbi:MAG: FGGY-family carbohydrate kinase, partial [Spirochaetota bacterium]|nr:FGGY-family carbohydrate kinase [Spirochaetota bacterium]